MNQNQISSDQNQRYSYLNSVQRRTHMGHATRRMHTVRHELREINYYYFILYMFIISFGCYIINVRPHSLHTLRPAERNVLRLHFIIIPIIQR